MREEISYWGFEIIQAGLVSEAQGSLTIVPITPQLLFLCSFE